MGTKVSREHGFMSCLSSVTTWGQKRPRDAILAFQISLDNIHTAPSGKVGPAAAGWYSVLVSSRVQYTTAEAV